MRIGILVCCFLLLVACSSSTTNDVKDTPLIVEDLPPLAKVNGTYIVNPLGDQDISFYGQRMASEVSSNGAGMMYPGGDAASFFVAIAMHAAIQGSVTSAAEQARIEEANIVLEPFKDTLDSLYLSDLMPDSLLSNLSSETNNDLLKLTEGSSLVDGWNVVIDPVFIMSRSQDSITAKVIMDISDMRDMPTTQIKAPGYRRTIYLQSLPTYGKDEWLQSDGEKFKATLQSLIGSSIDLGISDFSGLLPEKEPSATTVRYLDNGQKKVERGYLITQNCNHLTFESLRGEIKSMPKIGFKDCPN